MIYILHKPEKDILAGDKNTYTIPLPANTDIGKLEYLPRQDGENGIIRSFAISYSTTASGEDFTNIPLSSNTWEADKALKGIEFYAPDARRIREVSHPPGSHAQNRLPGIRTPSGSGFPQALDILTPKRLF